MSNPDQPQPKKAPEEIQKQQVLPWQPLEQWVVDWLEEGPERPGDILKPLKTHSDSTPPPAEDKDSLP